MATNSTKTDATLREPEAPSLHEVAVSLWRPPVDPGDAGGVGNGPDRNVVPGTLHEVAPEISAPDAAVTETVAE
jgi:hypothetical protein